MKVSRVIGQRPLEFVRRKTWTTRPVRFGNGISAVTSLCLCDEATTGGPSLLISGDEDGGVSVLKADCGRELSFSKRSVSPELRRVRLHNSCVNTIKVLPDQRGYVCAGDDGTLSVVASFEASSEEEVRKATLHLSGHSSFVTDCDTSKAGHGILSSSTDGKMLLWDPVASDTPVARVLVGRAIYSACFSAGDPYALICAPELGETCSSRGRGIARDSSSCSGSGRSDGRHDDLVQIWDLRFLRCYQNSIPAALARAFGEDPRAPTALPASMQPPPPNSPQGWSSSIWSCEGSAGSASTRSTGRNPGQVPSWLTTSLGSIPALSPATPLLRRSAWTEDSTDAGSAEKVGGRRGVWSCATPDSTGEKNTLPCSCSSSRTRSSSPASITRRGSECALTHGSTPISSARKQGMPRAKMAAPVQNGPFAVLRLASLPSSGCLHQGKGRSWVPGGLKTWQGSRRRALTAGKRRRAEAVCGVCDSTAAANAFSVQVSSDGRGILVASRDRTITVFDAQSREVVYRFGHPKLSTRARPIFLDGGNGGAGGWGRGRGGGGQGNIFAGVEGEVRCWRVGSQFPNRVFKPAGHHEGFEVCCLAISDSGDLFASADSSGTVCVQSASSGQQAQDGSSSGDGGGH